MTFIITHPDFIKHRTGYGHPEQPARVRVINEALKNEGLLENTLVPRKAIKEEVILCHTSNYFDLVQREISALQQIEIATLSTGDVQICADSFDIALFAVGGVLNAVDAVCEGIARNAFCNIRPPGHHATADRGMGFCLFNNVAIAARYVQSKYGIKNVLIVDWDVHHGNGTQEIFYSDPSVFYFSTHEASHYPFTGFIEEIGEGLGKGTTLNCPILPSEESREEVIEAFEKKLVPMMEKFKPEFIFISAGFDAHIQDPLGHFNLSDNDYMTLTRIVKTIADNYASGRIVSVLEGGYHLRALASAAKAHVIELAK
jgi:acetoin utilization deacetylase AcuC-like enzyme